MTGIFIRKGEETQRQTRQRAGDMKTYGEEERARMTEAEGSEGAAGRGAWEPTTLKAKRKAWNGFCPRTVGKHC